MNCSRKAILVAGALLCLNFPAYSQHISLEMNDVSVKKAMTELKEKSGYSFVYTAKDVDTKKTVSVKSGELSEVIEQILEGQNLTYEINGKNIILKKVSDQTPVQKGKMRKVSGVVLDPAGEPVIGATIREKGTSNGVITDMDGHFELEMSENALLHVSYIGFAEQDLAITGKNNFSIKLKEDTKVLEEVVVVGYMTQKKTSLTGSVANMKVDDNARTIPTTSAGNLLVGKLAGVNVGTASAIPGEEPKISIRTGSSWNDQNVTYVIDGVVRGSSDFNALSPNEIDNVTVLKDAASTAIYGSRAAGGVIMVTTKKGTKGKPSFSYSYGYSMDTRTKNSELTNAVQTGELYNRINGDADPANWAWSQEELDYIAGINGGWGYDQLDEVWNNPVTQTHNLSVDGGNDKVRYFGAVSYVQQQGFLEPMKYDKFNFRMNVTADITDNFELFTGFALYNNHTNSVNGEGGSSTYSKLRLWQPDQPVFTDSGQYMDYGWIGNVGARIDGASGYEKTNWLKPQMIVKGTYKMPFLKGLSASVQYSKSWSNNIQKGFYTNYDMMVTKRSGAHNHIVSTKDADIIGVKRAQEFTKDYIERKSTWSDDMQLNFQLNYDNTFGKHHVSGAFVTEWYEGGGAGVYGGREGFPVYLTDQFWAASDARADTWGGGDTDWEDGRMSYIGQFSYDYAGKYLLSFSFREDGSMKFAPNQRWGFFPAGSAGWVISEENFFNKKYVQFLKLRGSVGLTGNDAVGGWQWQESYKAGENAYFGKDPSRSTGLTYGSIVNPNLTWEKALTFDVGVDMTFLDNWNLAFDYWYRNSYDILGDRQTTLPSTFSQSMPAENYGEIHAQGIDFSLGYRGQSKDFTYYGNLTMSYGWNEVIKKDYAANAQWIDIPVGKSTSYLYGYKFDKIIRTQEELDAFNQEHPNYTHNGLKPELGMMVYKDLNGPDGVPDGIIDSYDRVMLKANNQPFVYGLNLGGSWKGLSLDMMFSGELGVDKGIWDLVEGVEWNRMWSEWYDNSWTPENPNALLPKRKNNDTPKTYDEYTDFLYKKKNFMRLKYLTVSYDLPKNQFYNKIFENVRLFFTGTNLFILSKFNKNYYDPEIANGNAFPILRSYNFGVEVKF